MSSNAASSALSEPAAAGPDTDRTVERARHERRQQLLERLANMGADLADALRRQATMRVAEGRLADGADAVRCAAAYAAVARSVRQTLALSMRLEALHQERQAPRARKSSAEAGADALAQWVASGDRTLN